MSTPQIEFENVSKRFGGTVAVHPMNLVINKGEFLAIMGSSGCGKTTTLRMLAGLEKPSEGEIRLNRIRINEVSPARRNTPMVWQSLALFPFLSVVENVEFGLKMRGVGAKDRRQRAMQWLGRMEIPELADRAIDQLSGGQRQRVALARALVTEPPVLLLDEPLSALDANLVLRMQGVLSRLHRELGITFVYVTHSQSEAFAMADKVVIMNEGRIEQAGTPKEVFQRPASIFVAEFVGTNNILSGTVSGADDSGIRIQTRIGDITAATLPGRRIAAGDTLDLVISADRMNISESQVDRKNAWPCRLISEEFIGAVVTLLVETEQGVELKIQTQQKSLETFDLETGCRLWIWWPEDAVYIIADSA